MSVLEIALYCASFSVVFLYFFRTVHRSEFGVILVGYDIFFFLGCCVYPLALEAGVITPGLEGHAALTSFGNPGVLVALHVFAVAIGMLLGYLFGGASWRVRASAYFSKYRHMADFLVPDVIVAWRAVLLLGLAVLVAFMLIVGVDTALIHAQAARSGEFEGFGEDAKWLFLKTIGIACGLVFVFLPAILLSRRDPAFLLIYLVFVVILYVNAGARMFLFWMVVLPLLLYSYASQLLFSKRALAVIPLVVLVSAVILVYGKHLGYVPGAILVGETEAVLEAYQTESGIFGAFEALLRNTEGFWYSVAAGVNYFGKHGSLVPADVFAALIGFVPSRVMEWIGLGHIHYANVEIRLSCVNTEMYMLEGCTIPPHYIGYSAYLAPVAAGFFMSFIRSWCFGWFETMWVEFKKIDFTRSWFPYLGIHVVALLFTFIPTNLAMIAFIIVIILIYCCLKLAVNRIGQIISASNLATR